MVEKGSTKYILLVISSYFIGEYKELINHGLMALRECLPKEQELNTKVSCMSQA